MRTPGLFMTLTSITAVLFTASFPLRVSADILQFGPGALPGCAYQCKPLWSAQYDCPSEAVASECFCKSKYLTTLLQGAGGGGSICEDACPESGGGGADVRAWFEGVCASYLNQDQNQQSTTSSSVSAPTETTTATPTSPNPTDTTASPTATGTPNEGTNPNDPILSNNKQRLKAIDWWKKNWYWFVLVFLCITVPLTCYALWFPCRKWTRRQLIQRRARRPPPLPLDLDPSSSSMAQVGGSGVSNDTRYANGGVSSPGIPPVPTGALSNVDEQWTHAFSPSLTRDGLGYFPHYVAPPSPPPVGLVGGSRASPRTERQDSWERRVREEYEGKKSIGERLSFWKKAGGRGGEGGVEQAKEENGLVQG